MADQIGDNLSGREKRRLRRETERLGGAPAASAWKIWLAVIVFLALLVGGVAALVVSTSQTSGPATLATPIGPGDWTTGNTATSSVSLVEYSDFQCPACAYFAPLASQLLIDVPELQLTYRHFPLSYHQNAELAARSAEAAGRQGRFWEMHDALFEGQAEWEGQTTAEAETTFSNYALALGLNLVQFKQDLASPEVAAKVAADLASGLASGVNATPSFFLNGTLITNPGNYESFLQLVRAAVADASTTRP